MITLKTLSDATAQAVFDQVAGHMLTQMQQSSADDGSCFYRHPDGVLKCAAGALIGDDEYKPGWDIDGGTCWSGLVGSEEVPPEHEELITSLQHIHDNKATSEWYRWLINLAEENELEFKFEEKQ